MVALSPGSFAGEDDDPPAAPSAEEVDAAIARGVLALKEEQKPNGSFDGETGSTALAIFALSHSGVPADDRSVERGLRWMLANLGRPDTYGASLAIMALATLDRELHAKRIDRLAKLVQYGQCRNGQWSYQLKRGRSSGDNSNTQFALLALWYARGAGAEIDPEVWSKARTFFAESQNEDGGWGYSAKERTKSYGSMVATGLAALVLCRSGEEQLSLSDGKLAETPGVPAAVEWMKAHFGVDRNPEANFKLGGAMRGVRKEVKDSYWRHYWLWSLERAATLAGIEEFGGRRWYAEGARHLVDTQRDDGSWVGSEAPLFATSFALLFLSRSTRRAVATEPPLTGKTTTPTPR
jgi:hypothetical protein